MLVLILLTLTAIILTSYLFVKRQYCWGSVTFIVLIHDGTGINGDKFAMLPIKDLSGDMDTLKGLWKSHGYFYRYTDFNFMVCGTYSMRECGLQHRFKDKIDNFISFG